MPNKKNSRIFFVMSMLLLLTLCTSTMGKTIYVDDDAAGANDGSSWTNAYIYLQDALANANSSTKPVEIRVAQGVYKPDQGKNQTPRDGGATFQLINGIDLRGGYAGFGEPDPNARDISKHETILSGDLDGNDHPVVRGADLRLDSSRFDNSMSVVTSWQNDETATLDGCTITGGDLQGVWFVAPSGGAGLHCSWDSTPTIKNCNFVANSAGWNLGGAIFGGAPTLINCVFRNNYAEAGGALFYCKGLITNCSFIGNNASTGGALCRFRTITNCTFVANSAEKGGVLCPWEDNTIVANSAFAHNSADNGSVLFCVGERNTIITNCTFAHNVASAGAALICDSYEQQYPSNVQLKNCILWDGRNEIWNKDGSTITISYSDIQGGQTSVYDPCESVVWGEGNIDVEPCFVDPGRWVNANDLNQIVEPNDPNAVWVDGDYHLKSQAGRWEPASQSWVIDNVTSLCIDAGDPNTPVGDEPLPNGGRINMGAYGGTAEASMSSSDASKVVYIQWLGHSSVKVWADEVIIYIDPRNMSTSPHDATAVLVTHSHGDHFSSADIAKVSSPQTILLAPASVVQSGRQIILPGQKIELDGFNVIGVPAYNTNHPRANNWLGFIIEIASKRIYIAGDTDVIEEMKTLGNINVAILPSGGTYTMNAQQAAEATKYIKPQLAIPYHWGEIVGTLADAQKFASYAACNVKIMSKGEILSSQDWLKDFSFLAHWKLDETAGLIAQDSAGDKDGTVNGNPIWQTTGGKIDGAILLDGDGDYISTPFVLNPSDGSFSVFAWVKGGSPGQVVLSQIGGVSWLSADSSAGNLMTELKGTGRNVKTLTSQTAITDGDWHRVGLVWDGSNRVLYVDDVEAAADTQGNLAGLDGGLNISAGKSLEPGSFWSGLIDDVRIHNRAVVP